MNKKTIHKLMERIFKRMSDDLLNDKLPDDIRAQNYAYNNSVLDGIYKKYTKWYLEYLGIEVDSIPGDID